LPPTTILSFDDRELAALRSAAAKLLPEQRDQFLRDVAGELKRCRKLGPNDRTGHAVAQVAIAVATAIANAVQRRLANGDLASNGDGDDGRRGGDARAALPRNSRTSRGFATPLAARSDF
jgi:hypothetical protein